MGRARRPREEGTRACGGLTPAPASGALAREGAAGLGSVRLGSARLGSARLSSAPLGYARLDSARLGRED